MIEIDRLLGPLRAERAHWLLARLAGNDDPASPEQLREMLGATYRQPERLLPMLAFWRERLGPHEATRAGLGSARRGLPSRAALTRKERAMQILERYFAALRTQDWESLAACVAENVHRTGPYLDVVRGRSAYVAFLARVIPALRSYELRVTRVRELGGASAVVELSEFAEVNGVRTEFPEVLLFDFDADGSILRIDIYIKQPPG